jgi:hypothetical protein
MLKHKFGVTCPSTLFVKAILVPPEHKKNFIDVLCHERTRMHYVTHISYWMHKHKFSITCPDALFVETALGPPKH